MAKQIDPIKSSEITPSQSMSLILSTAIGVGVLTLPRTSTQYAHQQGWVAVLVGFLVTFISIWIITLLCAQMKGKTFAAFISESLSPLRHPWVGKILGAPIILAYVGYWLVGTALVARTFGEVVVTAVLINTPLEVIVASMLLVSMYFCLTRDSVVFRLNEFLVPLMVVPLLVLAVLALQNSNFARLMPVLPLETKGVFKSVMQSIFVYQGYEVILQFSSRFSTNVRYMKANLVGIGFVGLVYTLIVIAGIASFGHEEMQLLTWPTLELVKATSLPGLILERAEAVFIGVWVAAVFTTTANWYYAGRQLFCQALGIRKQIYVTIGLCPLLYFIAMYPRNLFDLFAYVDRISWLGLTIGVVIPPMLLLISLLRKRGRTA